MKGGPPWNHTPQRRRAHLLREFVVCLTASMRRSSSLVAVLLFGGAAAWPSFASKPAEPAPVETGVPYWRQAKDWAPPWTVYLAVAIAAATILFRMAEGQGQKGKGERPKPGSFPKPPPPTPEEKDDEVEPSTPVMLHTYMGYAYLIVRGVVLDLLQGACTWPFMLTLPWRRADARTCGVLIAA